MVLHGKTWKTIYRVMNEPDVKLRLQQVVDRQQVLLGDFNAALMAGDRAKQASIELQLRKLQSEMQRLSDDLRYVQLDQSAGRPRTQVRMTGKAAREIALDAIDEIGVPVSPSTISEFSLATTGVAVGATRFASLRRDEERAARRDSASRPAWVAPALSAARLTALPRLFTSSAWEVERRLVGARSARVNHLYTTLAFLSRFERMRATNTDAGAMENLVVRYARGVPGATSTGTAIDCDHIRTVVQAELKAIEPEDLKERREAAARLLRHRAQEKLWGLPSVIEGGAQGKRAEG
jgi:hypothetical protein